MFLYSTLRSLSWYVVWRLHVFDSLYPLSICLWWLSLLELQYVPDSQDIMCARVTESVRIYGYVGCRIYLSWVVTLHSQSDSSPERKPKTQHVQKSLNCWIKGILLSWILPWKPFHCCRVKIPDGTGDQNDDHSSTVKCLGIYWALIICVPKLRTSVYFFIHASAGLSLPEWLPALFLLPQGPVFISTVPITHRKGMKQPSNYRKKASKPKGVTFSEKWYF